MRYLLPSFLVLAVLLAVAPAQAEVPAGETAEITVGEDAQLFRRSTPEPEPRTQEYDGLSIEVNPTRKDRINRLFTLAELVVPLIAGAAGGAAGPKILSVFTTLLQVRKAVNPQPGSTPPPSGPLSGVQGSQGINHIAEVLSKLALVFAAIESLSAQAQAAAVNPAPADEVEDENVTPDIK